MSVLVVGTTALDSIKTPYAENPRLLGGSASHAAVAASFFAPVHLVGVVGEDFPDKYVKLYRKHGINLDGLHRATGKTFHWGGEYEVNMNNRRTLFTELGVIENFSPELPAHYRHIPYVLLANISPGLQLHVPQQMAKPKSVLADTMDLWINIALPDLLKLLRRVDAIVVNDSEARHLTGEDNLPLAIKKIHRLGPAYVIVKKGEHGAILSAPGGHFIAPAFPLEKVVDPTGAGDSFVGGLIGYLAGHRGSVNQNLRKAIIYGSVVASFCCEGFGLGRTTKATRAAIEDRASHIKRLTHF